MRGSPAGQGQRTGPPGKPGGWRPD